MDVSSLSKITEREGRTGGSDRDRDQEEGRKKRGREREGKRAREIERRKDFG